MVGMDDAGDNFRAKCKRFATWHEVSLQKKE